MSKKPIKDQLKSHLEQPRLTDEQVAKLNALMAGQSDASNADAPAKRSRRVFIAGMATAASVAGLGLGSWTLLGSRAPNVQQLTAEILYNHIWLKPLDVAADRLHNLDDYFYSGLQFQLVRSAVFPHEQLQLEGGRFCSLDGARAAQLLFRDEQGRAVTMYQAPYRAKQTGQLPRVDRHQAPIRKITDGYRISVWVEGEVLMASAEPMNG